MKKDLIRKVQLVLLLAAVALAGSTFLPTGAEAGTEPCGPGTSCNGGTLLCGWKWDPLTGTREPCFQSHDCV